MADDFLSRLKNSPEPGRPKVDLPDRDCPRCRQPVPVVNGQHLMGRSRKDRSIEICSACAAHEAFQKVKGIDLATQEWPVEVPSSFRY